jgi:hypothetical protein
MPVYIEGRAEEYLETMNFVRDYYGDEYGTIDYHD